MRISLGVVWFKDALCAFPIVPGLSVMVTGVNRRLRGTCWSAPICFWRDIFKLYIPPYMPRGWFKLSNGILYSQEHPLSESIKFDTSMLSDRPPCMCLPFVIKTKTPQINTTTKALHSPCSYVKIG